MIGEEGRVKGSIIYQGLRLKFCGGRQAVSLHTGMDHYFLNP